MADFVSQSTDGAPVNSDHPLTGSEQRLTGAAEGNHAPPKPVASQETPSQATDTPADDRSGLDRAEEFVDQIAGKLSSVTSDWGRKLLRLSSRARESVQDFWAEVQDFRQGKKP
jgi:hypothetical protein